MDIYPVDGSLYSAGTSPRRCLRPKMSVVLEARLRNVKSPNLSSLPKQLQLGDMHDLLEESTYQDSRMHPQERVQSDQVPIPEKRAEVEAGLAAPWKHRLPGFYAPPTQFGNGFGDIEHIDGKGSA